MKKIMQAAAIAASTLCGMSASSQAQIYPDRPIKVIVSIAAGSVTDVIVRMMDKELTPRLGQSMIVENRGGASGILAAQACKGSPNDGYTLCVIYHSTLSYNPFLFDKLPYDADKDFALITRLFFLVEGLAVSGASGVTSVADLKAQALAKPDAFNFGTLGAGSFPELFLKWANTQWGTKIAAVPFRGGGPVAQALAAGDLQIGNMGLGNFMPLIPGGKVKVIAVMSPQRTSLLPEVPTFEEAGLGGYKGRGWWGLAAPAGTPKSAIDKLNAEFTRLLREPAFAAQLDRQATIAAPTTPEEFAAFVQEDRKAAQELIRIANTPRTDYTPQ